jgi:hypothetical protein
MARINAVLACDPDDSAATKQLQEEIAQCTLDELYMYEVRDGGPNAPWPYELQPLLQIPAFPEELEKAGVHSLQQWGEKIVDSLHAIPMFAAVEDLPEETRDQLAKKNRFRNALNELVSLLRNDEIYYDEFHDRIAKLADKRRGTRPTLSDPIDIGGTQIMIRQTNAYADRVYDAQLGDDWLDSADSYFNTDRLKLWTAGMVSAWIKQTHIEGIEAVSLWALQAQLVDGLSGLHTELQKPGGPPCELKAEAAAELIKRVEAVQSNAAQLDELWKERANNFAADLADRTRYRHVVQHIPRRPRSPGKFLVEDKWSAKDRTAALQKLKKSELRKLATKLGVDEDELDDAYDAPDIQAALIDLVVAREAKQRAAAAAVVDSTLDKLPDPTENAGASDPVTGILKLEIRKQLLLTFS